MAGQVQMVYIDPPYGIKYGSNFQPFVNKRDVKDKKDEDLSTEPETIKAFRDTWELGIHSYLTYLRDRLLLARELLSDSGSVFVQISDENAHLVRNLCDEIFGVGNFISMISFRKTSNLTADYLPTSNDYIIWFSKDKKNLKFNRIFINKTFQNVTEDSYGCIEMNDGTWHRLSQDERESVEKLPKESLFGLGDLTSSHEYTREPFIFKGKKFAPQTRYWSTSKEGLERLAKANRLAIVGETLRYKRFFNDFPVMLLNNIWNDTGTGTRTEERIYVVQTGNKPIQRCILMTTDPGDLVLDITCGSGTTAYVAEQWGRRWITCDTSRIAITLAKKRLMTATFDFYKIKNKETTNSARGAFTNQHEQDLKQQVSEVRGKNIGENPNCPANGFIYKTVPLITLKSIANNEPPEQETLYDQPEIDKRKIRITGPFTVEALPAPVVKPLYDEDDPAPFFSENAAKKQFDWMQELQATGISGRQGEKMQFSRIEALEGTQFLQAEAETKEPDGKKAVICFAGETRPLDIRMVTQALDEAETIRPKPVYIIFASFQFDPTAAKHIDDTKWPGVTLLKAQMNPDLMTADLKKKVSSSQSFWLVGQPDVELIHIDKDAEKGKYKIKVNGFDYFDIKQGIVNSGNTDQIAMWMLDTDYDGMSIEPKQVFFPKEEKNEGWDKLAKTLKAEINHDLIEKYRGTESLPFTIKDNSKIAVKIVDDRGIESLKVIAISIKGE
jgi:adenine-specific DNA-methyltransferase